MTEPFASPFIAGTNIQYAWDSTSLTKAMECPYRYKLEIIDGWVSKAPDTAVALAFGILLHYGVEQYHRLRVAGLAFDEAVATALKLVSTYRDPRAEPGSPGLLEQLPTDDDIGVLKQEDADDEESDGFDLRNSKVRTRYHLFRALVWYFDHYRQDAMHVVTLDNGEAAVEHTIRVPTGEALSDGTQIVWSGHLDHLVEFNGQLFVKDLKTTKSITRTYKKGFDISHQMSGYTLAGQIAFKEPVAGVYIDAVQLQVGGVKFNRFPTHRSKSQLAEFIRVQKYYADQAEMWYMQDFYPQNTSACFLCPLKEVCAQPPEFRKGFLQTYYKQQPFERRWNPLAIR